MNCVHGNPIGGCDYCNMDDELDAHLATPPGGSGDLAAALAKARDKFREYEHIHWAKNLPGSNEKALANAAMADMCSEALRQHAAQPAGATGEGARRPYHELRQVIADATDRSWLRAEALTQLSNVEIAEATAARLTAEVERKDALINEAWEIIKDRRPEVILARISDQRQARAVGAHMSRLGLLWSILKEASATATGGEGEK